MALLAARTVDEYAAAVSALRSSRISSRDRASGLSRHAALLLVGVTAALVVPWAPAIAMGVALNGFAVTSLVLALKTRLVVRHPGRVGGTVAVVSTIEYAGFGPPLLAGRVADADGVRAGLALLVMLAVVPMIATLAGDHASKARAI